MSANKEFAQSNFNRESLSKFFVYESYDEESGLFFNRGSCGFVLCASPTPGLEMTAENEIAEFVKNEENMPGGASMQVLMIGSSDISYLLNRWSGSQQGKIYQELAAQRTSYLTRKAKEAGVVKDVTILISVTIPKTLNGAQLIAMQRRKEILISTLKSIHLYCQEVDDHGLIRILRKLWGNAYEYKGANSVWPEVLRDQDNASNISSSVNVGNTNPPHQYQLTKLSDYRTISEQILAGDFELYEDQDLIHLGDDHCALAMNVEDRPGSWSLPLMDHFIGNELRKEYIKTDYLIHVGFQVLENQTLAKSNAFAKREAIGKNIKAGLNKFFPDLDAEFEDLSSSVKALQAKDRMINFHMNVVLLGTKEQVIIASKEYSSMMRRNGFNFVPSRYDHLLVMLSVMPMAQVWETSNNIIGKRAAAGYGVALTKLNRYFKTVSGETTALLPIVGEWKGDLCSPGMLLIGRRGQLMYWSQFGSELVPHLSNGNSVNAENYNVCIAGVSGSGKSVFMQEMMKSILSVGGKVFVLDYGRSFEELCKTLEGNYIEFDPARPMSINPFSSVPTGHDKLSIEARNDFLASFPITLATMAAPKLGTSDLQFKILKRALFEVWEQHQNNTQIDDIVKWLCSQDGDEAAKDLGKMLFDYTKSGSYGGFFAGPAQVSLNADIVVIETDYLRNYPDLMAVVMQTMITHINHTMAKSDRLKPSLIVIDEMAKTLQSQLALQFISETVRIVRRYKASVVVATQLLTDFYNMGPYSSSIFAGSAFKIILKQNSDVLNSCKSIPLLKNYVDTEGRYRRMNSVESRKNEFSECTIWSEGVYGVIARLRLDPFTLLLMSTNPTDKNQIANYKRQGFDLADSIRKVLSDRGQLQTEPELEIDQNTIAEDKDTDLTTRSEGYDEE